ncbi:MAG: guanylate kinase [Planctomycetes bacterium]|nr:guanylate kinase [Planctomycetota bacterium]
MPSDNPGKLVVISGPAGAGKSTVLREVFHHCRRPLSFSVSATTRPPRPGELNGRDYHFLTPAEFQKRRAEGDFLECFEVFGRGHWYGTLWSEVTPSLEAGKWVVLEVDVDGAMAVLERFPQAITIFVRPRSIDVLRKRLEARGTEAAAEIERRLEVARQEMTFADRYQHQVINDDVQQAVNRICQILEADGTNALPAHQ